MTTLLDTGPPRTSRLWSVVAAVEVVLAIVTVALDLLIPTLVILLLAGLSLVVRRRGPAGLGFHRLAQPWPTTGRIFGVIVGWTAVQFGLVMPVLNHLTGDRQDLEAFDELQGNVGLLAALLVASWTLGLAEEAVFRGYLQTRVLDVLGRHRSGIVVAVLLSSVLFGLIHTEQGVIGVVVTFLDGLLFSWLRWHDDSVWAGVLGHGFSNTLGITAFFVVGPVYGLW